MKVWNLLVLPVLLNSVSYALPVVTPLPEPNTNTNEIDNEIDPTLSTPPIAPAIPDENIPPRDYITRAGSSSRTGPSSRLFAAQTTTGSEHIDLKPKKRSTTPAKHYKRKSFDSRSTRAANIHAQAAELKRRSTENFKKSTLTKNAFTPKNPLSQKRDTSSSSSSTSQSSPKTPLLQRDTSSNTPLLRRDTSPSSPLQPQSQPQTQQKRQPRAAAPKPLIPGTIISNAPTKRQPKPRKLGVVRNMQSHSIPQFRKRITGAHPVREEAAAIAQDRLNHPASRGTGTGVSKKDAPPMDAWTRSDVKMKKRVPLPAASYTLRDTTTTRPTFVNTRPVTASEGHREMKRVPAPGPVVPGLVRDSKEAQKKERRTEGRYSRKAIPEVKKRQSGKVRRGYPKGGESMRGPKGAWKRKDPVKGRDGL